MYSFITHIKKTNDIGITSNFFFKLTFFDSSKYIGKLYAILSQHNGSELKIWEFLIRSNPFVNNTESIQTRLDARIISHTIIKSIPKSSDGPLINFLRSFVLNTP